MFLTDLNTHRCEIFITGDVNSVWININWIIEHTIQYLRKHENKYVVVETDIVVLITAVCNTFNRIKWNIKKINWKEIIEQ